MGLPVLPLRPLVTRELFGPDGVVIAVTTAATIGNNSQASSALVDNSQTLFLDAFVTVRVTVGTIVAPSYVNIYAAGTSDGATFGGNETGMGQDAAVTLTSPPNIRLAGMINAPTSTTAYQTVFSVAAAFGGLLPLQWCLVIENKTGAALTAATAFYQGVWSQQYMQPTF